MSEPTWEVAHLFPEQGMWSEEEYLMLNGNRLLEYSEGCLEVLPMPTELHQALVLFLYRALVQFIAPGKLGKVLVAPFRVRLWSGKFREPDVLFMLKEHAARRHDEFWEGADLVMEVLSSDDRSRDLETKRREYAQAAIPEYWIIDPQPQTITVLRLAEGGYELHGEFGGGSQATSVLLPGFQVDVTAAFQAAQSEV